MTRTMWPVAALLALALAGLPLVVVRSASLALLAVAAAAVCAVGIAAGSMPAVTAGATLAAIEYALAVWIAAAPVDVPVAALFGVLLFQLLAMADHVTRTRGVAVTASVTSSLARYWLAVVGAAIGAIVVLVVAAAALGLMAWLLPYNAAVALGTAGAVLVMAGAFKLLVASDDTESKNETGHAPLA